MRKNFVWIVFLVLGLVLASNAWAQGIPTGLLNGRVTDETGAPLPGVSVSITSPALQGSRATVSNVNGDFNFPNLPPGDYSVKFALSGFQPVTKSIKVSSGQQVAANAKLSLAGVATEVSVCLLYTSPSPRDRQKSRMPSSA